MCVMDIDLRLCACVHTYVYLYICMYVYMCMYVYICIYVCVCTCIYLYINTYTYIPLMPRAGRRVQTKDRKRKKRAGQRQWGFCVGLYRGSGLGDVYIYM